jgi:hypothetical protein
VTHPFHPLAGLDFEFVAYRQNWGEHRVYLHDEDGQLFSLLAAWTDAVAADPFVVVAAARAPFSTAGLLATRAGRRETADRARVPAPTGTVPARSARVKKRRAAARSRGRRSNGLSKRTIRPHDPKPPRHDSADHASLADVSQEPASAPESPKPCDARSPGSAPA